jgi:hypothetical protein
MCCTEPPDATRLHRKHNRVIETLTNSTDVLLRLDSGEDITVDAAVLALGVFPPDCEGRPRNYASRSASYRTSGCQGR